MHLIQSIRHESEPAPHNIPALPSNILRQRIQVSQSLVSHASRSDFVEVLITRLPGNSGISFSREFPSMKRILICVPAFALVAASVLPLMADEKKVEPKSVAGHWEGVLQVTPTVQLRIRFDLDKSPKGEWSGTWASPDQIEKNLELISITVAGNTLDLETKIAASYHGTFDPAKDTLEGKWEQGGVKFPLNLKRYDPKKVTETLAPKELEGLWKGKIKVQAAIELRLVLVVKKGQGDKPTAHLASPDQGVDKIPINRIELKSDELTFDVKSIGASYKGKRNAAGTAFEGTFKQSGLSFPLVLTKTEKVSEVIHPQTPKGPFPYRTEEVTYENRAGGIKLAGTLSLPAKASPVPAVLLITGSGAQDRDETLLGHKPFLVLADALTRRGIAVLRVDDRGVGGSTGSTSQSTSQDFALDALAGVEFLAHRKEVDPKRIGLIGHSEGGLIAPIAATRSKDIAFIVLMAGTGLSGFEILDAQAQLILKASGASKSELAFTHDFHKQLQSILGSEKDPKALAAKLSVALKGMLDKLPEAERKEIADSESLILSSVERVTTPWFRYFLEYDPRPTLRKVQCPVLALNGEKDLQVPCKQNLSEIEKAIKSNGNDHVKIVEFPGLNHLFQPCTTGSPGEYASIETTIAPEVLKTIGDWILSQPAPTTP
jgi:pimeloyl-ACP methyl ester carboxylesterase